MADTPWVCPDCGLEATPRPDQLPAIELTEEAVAVLHQWARHFEHLNHDQYAEDHPEPPPTALDFVHWVKSSHARHSHSGVERRHEPAGRPGRRGQRLEARATAA